MKAIETLYKNVTYKSRLESRWALFFDLIEIKFTYEPEGFTNEIQKYLPDFFLHNVSVRDNKNKGVYVEIKPNKTELKKYENIANWFEYDFFIFCGTPDICKDYNEGIYQLNPFWDNYMYIHKCNKCGDIKLEFSEGQYDVCNLCKTHGHVEFNNVFDKIYKYKFY